MELISDLRKKEKIRNDMLVKLLLEISLLVNVII